jgi:hypothetical protein
MKQCSVDGLSTAAPGNILEFHAYNHQDHSKHAEADTRAAFMRRFQDDGNVVDGGRVLVKARARKLPWESVQPFFDCLFSLQRQDAPASPGDFAKEI